jgi:hypothetical protein
MPSTGHAQFDQIVPENCAWLAERGETIVGSGCFNAAPLSGALHTDFGPGDQDKGANQDYALIWRPGAHAAGKGLRLAVAMADGLTTSFRSECASALACWVALRALVDAGRSQEPLALAQRAFREAGQTIGRLADELVRDPEASCPPGQFLSTWKYILKKGGLFQTTLTLAWLDEDVLRLAAVGDGGALLRVYHEPSEGWRATDFILAECDLDSQHVHALGPADRGVQEFDFWREEKLRGPFLCALHTDGVGRGLGRNPLALLDELEVLQADGAANPARQFIEQVVFRRPKDFDDNLTLAVLRTDETQ